MLFFFFKEIVWKSFIDSLCWDLGEHFGETTHSGSKMQEASVSFHYNNTNR